MTTQNQNNFTPLRIDNSKLPEEGPRVVPQVLRWTVSQDYEMDMTYVIEQKQMSYVQTVMIDNRFGTGVVTVQTAGLPYAVAIGPGQQAFLPLLTIQQPKITATSSTAGGYTTVYFLNFPVSPCVWGSGADAFTFDAEGCLLTADCNLLPLIGNWNGAGDALAVADLALQALISDLGSGDGLAVNVLSGGGGGGGSALVNEVQGTVGASLNTTIYTPGGGLRFNLIGLWVYLMWNGASNFGNINWNFNDASASPETIAGGTVYGQFTAPAAGIDTLIWSSDNLNYVGRDADGLFRWNGGINAGNFIRYVAHFGADQ